jgi:hypothetical protein
MAAGTKDTSFTAETRALGTTAMLKDLLGTAIITMLILTPIVSFKTIMAQGTLLLDTRWKLALTLTALVVGARLLLHLFVWKPRPTAAATTSAAPAPTPAWRQSLNHNFTRGLFAFALMLPFILMLIGGKNGIFPGWDKRGIDFFITT